MRNALIDEPLSYVTGRSFIRRELSREVGLLKLAFAGIRKQVVGKLRRHDPLPRERKRHSRRIDRDPPPPPFFAYQGRCSRSAGRIEHEIPRIGGHQEASLDDFHVRLDYIYFRIAESGRCCIVPQVSVWKCGKVVEIAHISTESSQPLLVGKRI